MLSRRKTSRFARRVSVSLVVLIAVCISVPAAAQIAAETVTMETVGCGEMLWRGPDGLAPLPAVSTDVRIRVTGPLVSGVIAQRFFNPTDGVIEAIYVFPLPENAAVHEMEIIVGERRIVSVVQEKQEARRTYEKARDEGRRAALVEGERPNLFTTSVANIGPGETVTVELRYLDRADFVDGVFGLVFPLTFTPRYIPPAATRSAEGYRDAARISPPRVGEGDARFPTATMLVELIPGVELADVTSASHELAIDRDDDAWLLSPRAGEIPADRDFLLNWRPAASRDPASVFFVEDRPDGRYALLMIVPSAERGAEPDIPTETLFVIDVSGSMQGASITQARTALLRALDRLRPGDRFNIMSFSNDSHLFRRSFLAAEPEALGQARAWVRRLRADGGTEIHPALLRAMSQFLGGGGNGAESSRRIILITDAAIGNEDQLLREAAGDLGSLRLHVVGIGSAPNRHLVRRLAALGGGLSTFVSERSGTENGIDRFLERISRPQIVEPELAWDNATALEAYPDRLPELYAGELLLWSGRFPVDADLSGRFTTTVAGRPLRRSLAEMTRPSDDGGVATRWARLKVRDLMAELHGGADPDSVRDRVVATALDFGLVTRFTSRVAVEEIVTAQARATPHRLPNGLPAGSRFLQRLPGTGTARPLLRLLGALALSLGVAGIVVARRSGP